MADDCAQLQTEAPMGGQEHITGHVRTHVAIAQDEVGEHREYRFTRGALDAPNGEPTQPDTRIMRMACQTPSPAASRFVFGDPVAYGQKTAGRARRWQLTVAKRLYCSEFTGVPIT